MENKNDVQALLTFDDFVIKFRMMDEACRLWCCFIDDAPERRDVDCLQSFIKKSASRSMRNI